MLSHREEIEGEKPCIVTASFPVSVLTSQQMSALTSLTMGKAGGGGATTIPAGQFIQLTGGGQGAGVAVPAPQGAQSLHTQLAFQKAGGVAGSGQTLQFHQLQLKQAPTLTPAAAMATAAAKSKVKKRGGATPPKSL